MTRTSIAPIIAAAFLWVSGGLSPAEAACETCANFAAGARWGTVTASALTEASGIAASSLNPGVLWTHNDGARQKLFAVSTNGALLATFDLKHTVQDVEDIAVGPGPEPGVSYIYLGDIGASGTIEGARAQVQVLRIPEPVVDLSWSENPRSADIPSVTAFALAYPDGAYDAEGLMVDSQAGTLFVVTKQPGEARVYGAQLGQDSALTLNFEISVPFSNVSAADISADGTRVVFRNEDFATLWARCADETIRQSLAREGKSVPVIGTPEEPNGEGIGFLRDGTGYVTISEGLSPGIYFFQSLCPTAPSFTTRLADQSAYAGARVEFSGAAVGYPAPVYSWRFNSAVLPGQSSPSLIFEAVTPAQSGTYELVASNASGTAITSAALTVHAKPDLRITEVQSSTAPSPNLPTADWWELTSFESRTVSLSGWKFNDNAGGLTDPYVLGAGLAIAPGESIIFVEGLSAAQFRVWWGDTNLPANLQIISYTGPGLSLSATGDGLRLWTDVATVQADTVSQVDFAAALNGVSFGYNPVTGQFGQVSQVGVFGAFKAASSADVGSPGRILSPATNPVLRVQLEGTSLRIVFEATAGHWYRLQASASPAGEAWTDAAPAVQAASDGSMSFAAPAADQRKFFRVAVD